MEEIRICAFIDSLVTRETLTQNDMTNRNQLIQLIRSIAERTSNYSDNAENLGGIVIFSPSAQSTTFEDFQNRHLELRTLRRNSITIL